MILRRLACLAKCSGEAFCPQPFLTPQWPVTGCLGLIATYGSGTARHQRSGPAIDDRLRFFGSLHVTAIITLISLMVGFGGAIAIVPMIDPAPRLLAVLVTFLMGLGIAMMALAILSLVLARDHAATARDIAAALAAATSEERSVLLFRAVHEELGTKARRRHLAGQEAHLDQASAIERLSVR